MAGMTQDGMIESASESLPTGAGAWHANSVKAPCPAAQAARVHDARLLDRAPAQALQAAR
jgi:hypothetical protein